MFPRRRCSRTESPLRPGRSHRLRVAEVAGAGIAGAALLAALAQGKAAPVALLPGWAALVLDVQPCFVSGGVLAVSGADASYLRALTRATRRLYREGLLILGSRDYHPSDHVSFARNHPGAEPFQTIRLPDGREQILWPPHCVQTAGDSRVLIDNNLFFEVVKKGQNPRYDSYSAFRDDGGDDTELDSLLTARGVRRLVVYGIATDYCVRFTVLDALRLGYSVTVVEDLIRGVAPETTAAALTAMKAAGAEVVPSIRGLRLGGATRLFAGASWTLHRGPATRLRRREASRSGERKREGAVLADRPFSFQALGRA